MFWDRKRSHFTRRCISSVRGGDHRLWSKYLYFRLSVKLFSLRMVRAHTHYSAGGFLSGRALRVPSLWRHFCKTAQSFIFLMAVISYFWYLFLIVSAPLGSQRCNIVCVSYNQAALGNFGVRAPEHVLTERLGRSSVAEEAVIFCYFHGDQSAHEEIFIRTALSLLVVLLMIIIQPPTCIMMHRGKSTYSPTH